MQNRGSLGGRGLLDVSMVRCWALASSRNWWSYERSEFSASAADMAEETCSRQLATCRTDEAILQHRNRPERDWTQSSVSAARRDSLGNASIVAATSRGCVASSHLQICFRGSWVSRTSPGQVAQRPYRFCGWLSRPNEVRCVDGVDERGRADLCVGRRSA